MDFELPPKITAKLAELDAFIEAEIKPLERENMQFFDHRREHARTDWENDGRPRDEWHALIAEMERRADRAGHLRYGLPKSCGGQAASNLAIAAIREHLAAKGLGLHNDLQDESSIVGNFPDHPCARRLRHAGAEALHRGHHQARPASRLRPDRAQPRQRRDLAGDHGRARRRPLGHQRPEALQQPGAARARQPGFRAHVGQAGRRRRHHRLHRADRYARAQRPLQSLDLQHAQRPRRGRAEERARARQRDPAQGRRGPRCRAALRAREPHPPGGGERRRRALLHRAGREIRQVARRLRRAAVEEAGDPVPPGRAVCRVRDGAQLHLPDGLADGPPEPARDQRHGVDLQLPREPAVLRGRGPRDAGARRHRLQPRAAVRAHLPASPPLSHHRRLGGGADAPGRAIPVRLRAASRRAGDDGADRARPRRRFRRRAARRVPEGLARRRRSDAGRAHGRRHVEPDLLHHGRRPRDGAAQAAGVDADAVGARDRPRIPRAHGAAGQLRSDAGTLSAIARIARSSARRSI